MGKTFSQKRVWHSFLKSKSPLVISLKGDPMDSKYGDNPIVYFEVRGDDFDGYYYEIEQPGTAAAVDSAPKNTWLTVTASGTADEQFIAFAPAAGGPLPGVPMSGGGSNTPDVDYSTGNVSGDYQRCLEEAKGIALSWGDDFDSAIPAEAIHAMAATMFIQWSYTKFRRPLNASDAETVETVDEDKSDDYATDIRDLIGQLTITSGTAHDDRKLKTTLGKFDEALEGHVGEELHARMSEWLVAEIDYQTAPEMEDDLPF